MIEIEYNEESCTEWYTEVRGATTKEAILAFINEVDSEEVLTDIAQDLATRYGDYRQSILDTCEDCGHYPSRYVLTIGED